MLAHALSNRFVSGFAAILIAVAANGGSAEAAEPAYTMGNYPVEATAANAVAAKDAAINDGQKAAFRSLLKRIVPVTAYKQLSRLSSVKASNLVSGVAVRSERNSATDYIASLDFSFEPDAVRSALSQQGIPFVDEQASSVTVVTALRQGNPATVTNDKGVWRRAWTGLDLVHTITPIAVEDLKSTIHSDTVDMLLSGDDNGLRILQEEYGTKLIVVAVAEPDFAAKKLLVTLAGKDAVGPFLLKRSYHISNGDLAYTSELAAVIALGTIEGRWKAVKSNYAAAPADAGAASKPVWSPEAMATGNGDPVSFVAEFAGPDQWNDLRSKLLDTPGVDSMEISTMSDARADVSLRFPGGAASLANALGARGLSFVNTADGWVLRASN